MKIDDFLDTVRRKMGEEAAIKGYSSGAVPNDLSRFTEKFFPNHALGEIVYKAIRYVKKKDPEDLEKIAAWACILWLMHYEKGFKDKEK